MIDPQDLDFLSGSMPQDILAIEDPAPYVPPKSPKPVRDVVLKELDEIKQRSWLRNDTIFRNRRLAWSATGFIDVAPEDDMDDSPNRQMAKLSVPHTIISETARILGRQQPLFEVASMDDGEDARQASEKQERFITYIDDRFQDLYLAGGGGDTIRIAKFKYLAQDGRLVQLVQPKPDRPAFPFKTKLLDPANVYVEWGEDEPLKVFYVTSMTVGQIRAEFGKTEKQVPGRPGEDRPVTWYFDSTWIAVWFSGEEALIRPTEHEMGGLPVIITHANGLTGSMSEGGNGDQSVEECYKGQGVFWPHLPEYTKWVQVVEAQVYDTIYNANPAYKKKLPPGNQNFETDVEPGKDVPIPNGADYEPMYRQGGLPFAKQTSELFSNLVQSGTLPIGQSDFNSGIDRMVATVRGQSFFIPLVEAMKSHDARVYSFILKFYKGLDMPPIYVTSGGDAGRRSRWMFSPDDVASDPFVSVEFGELAPPDLLAALNAATPAMAARMMDEETFWHDMVRHPKAKQIVDRIRSAQLRQGKLVQTALEQAAAVAEVRREADKYKADNQQDIADVLYQQASTMLQQLQMAGQQPQGPSSPMGDMQAASQLQSDPQSGIMNTDSLAANPIPIPGLSGGNGSNGMQGIPPMQGIEPEYAMPDSSAGINDPRLQAILAQLRQVG